MSAHFRHGRVSSRTRKITVGLLGSSVLALALLALRMQLRHDGAYGFLAWNLFLAWIPLVLAVAAITAWRSAGRISAVPLLVLWLLFFPNAPYVVTDFVHLRDIGGMPRWFDVLMLSSFAATSLALGFVSLYLIQNLIRATLGVAWSWVGAFTVIALSGVGIYLGRVDQINSWDVLNPGRLGAALTTGDMSEQTHRVLLTLLLTCMLATTYTICQRLAERSEHPAR